MKKIWMILLIVCLSTFLTGCYYGKSDHWEGAYALNDDTKKKNDAVFMLSFKDSKTTFEKIEITQNDNVIFKEKDFKEREFTVLVDCQKCIKKKKKTISITINWITDNKEYTEKLVLDKQ